MEHSRVALRAYLYWSYKNGVRKALNEPFTDAIDVTHVSQTFEPRVHHIAIDAERVYWTSDVGVLSAPKSGGPPVYVTCDAGFPRGIAVDDESVYWIDYHSIHKAPKPAP